MATDESDQLRVAALLLAGGESSRMGESKALLPWTQGSPLIADQIHKLHEAGYSPIVVVLGHNRQEIYEAIPFDVKSTIVVNEQYQKGRSSSIIAGVLQIAKSDTDAFLVASVDQPRSVEMLRALRKAWVQERPSIVMPSYQRRSGHPPLFSSVLIAEILAITEEKQGLRQVIRDFAGDRLFVNVDDPLALTNLNTREDYELALRVAKDQA